MVSTYGAIIPSGSKIDAIELIAGGLPRRQQMLVEAWAEIHQRELLEDWNQLQGGRPPFKIEPLR